MDSNFVDIWHGDILIDEAKERNYYLLLNEQEKQKVATFIRPELQKKYIKTRGVLRKTLSSYLNIEPEDINIKTTDYGKPFIDHPSLFFNLSHTANKFVIVVSNISEVGIDLEQNKPRKNLQGLVKKCFSEVEQVSWLNLPDEKKTIQFYSFWVKKEAFVKAVGRGIALGLDQCVINPNNQTQFLTLPARYGKTTDWNIVDIQLNKNDICALVIKNREFKYKQIEIK